MTPKKALLESIESVGGKKQLANSIGCTVRNINLMLASGSASKNYALKISLASGIHVSELCPDIYPKYIFGDVDIYRKASKKIKD